MSKGPSNTTIGDIGEGLRWAIRAGNDWLTWLVFDWIPALKIASVFSFTFVLFLAVFCCAAVPIVRKQQIEERNAEIALKGSTQVTISSINFCTGLFSLIAAVPTLLILLVTFG